MALCALCCVSCTDEAKASKKPAHKQQTRASGNERWTVVTKIATDVARMMAHADNKAKGREKFVAPEVSVRLHSDGDSHEAGIVVSRGECPEFEGDAGWSGPIWKTETRPYHMLADQLAKAWNMEFSPPQAASDKTSPILTQMLN